MRLQNALASSVALLSSLVSLSGCAPKLAPNQADQPLPPPIETSKAFRLGEPLAPDKAASLNDFQVVTSLPGREVHCLQADLRDPTEPSFLILNEIDASGVLSTQAFPFNDPKISNVYINAELASQTISDPQFSPDGRLLLFKYGQNGTPGLYRLYILDTQTRVLKLVPSPDLQYYAVSWSPDGEYIAFADSFGNPRFYDHGRDYEGTMKLYIYRHRTGKTQLVVSSCSLRGPWTWKAPHTLLYGSLTPQDEKVFLHTFRETGSSFVGGKAVAWEKIHGKAKRKPVVPNIYVYQPETRQTRLLQRDAYAPVVSSDGKRMAFLGSTNPIYPSAMVRDFTNSIEKKSVIVTEYGNPDSKRMVLSQHDGLYPHLMWRRNNQSLLVMQQTVPPPNALFEIREWNINQKNSRLVKVLKENDPSALRSINDPIFRPLTLSADDMSLFMLVDRYHPWNKNQRITNEDTLQHINLDTGEITVIGQVKNAIGIDWLER